MGFAVEAGLQKMKARFHPGDQVIYRKQKTSLHPTLRARCVNPAPRGDHYSYLVDKFWTVVAIEPNDNILVRTRRGKELRISADDPALRPARWFERLMFRNRFPAFVPMPAMTEPQIPSAF